MKKVLLVLCCIFLIGISIGCTQEDAEDVWTQNIYPATNNTYDIGSPALQYQDGYFVNLSTTNFILGGKSLNLSGTGFLYSNGSTVSTKNTFVYGLCTTGAATVAKNVTIGGYTPTIYDYISVNYSLGNTVAAATLNISGTGAKAIRMNNVALTAVFGTYTAGATILYYYDGTYYQQVASQRTTDTDTDTWDRISVPFALKAAVTTTRYKICLQATNDSYYPVSIGDYVTTNKTVSNTSFRLGGNILYYSSTTQVVGNLTTTNFYSMFPDANIHYSFNQNTSWVLNSSLYLRAIPNGNASFYLNNSTTTSWFTQTLPTTEDGQIYIYLGPVYAANSMVLMPIHPIYEFKNGQIRLYEQVNLVVPVWEDIRIVTGSFDRAGVTDPAYVAYTPNGSGISTYLTEWQTIDIASCTVQMPHAYKEGTDIYCHIHWTSGAKGTVESGNAVGWKVDYTWANIDGNFSSMATLNLSDVCDGVNHKHQMTPDILINGSGKTISSMLIMNIKRSDTGADDTWVGSTSGNLPMMLELDLHYQIDTLGSRQILVK